MLNVLLNLVLFTVKFIGGQFSHSVSVVSDAFNNLADAATTLMTWLGLKISSLGAGENHPNGHGRFEWIIALISGISVLLIGWELLGDSIEAIKNPEQTAFSAFTVIVLILSVGVKGFMYVYNRNKGKQQNSASLKAVSVDCLSDAVSTAVVLLSLIVSAFFAVNIDGWCGILVSLFIMYNGLTTCTETIERIMGRSASKEQLAEMRAFTLKNGDFEDVVDLQIEDYGYGRYRVSMTVLGQENADTNRLLADAMALKYQIYEKYGYNAQISVERNVPPNNDSRSFVEKALSKSGVPIEILSLRVNDAQGQKLVLLELGVEFTDNRRKKELEQAIKRRLQNAPTGYLVLPSLRLQSGQRHHGYERKSSHSA